MKEYTTSPQKKKQKPTGLFFIFEILSETALVLLSRLKGGSADEVSDRQ